MPSIPHWPDKEIVSPLNHAIGCASVAVLDRSSCLKDNVNVNKHNVNSIVFIFGLT